MRFLGGWCCIIRGLTCDKLRVQLAGHAGLTQCDSVTCVVYAVLTVLSQASPTQHCNWKEKTGVLTLPNILDIS